MRERRDAAGTRQFEKSKRCPVLEWDKVKIGLFSLLLGYWNSLKYKTHITVSYQRKSVSSISCHFRTLNHQNFTVGVALGPLLSMITFIFHILCSDCKFFFLVPGITHSQETKNHDKQQAFHLSLFFGNRMVLIETENQNKKCHIKSANWAGRTLWKFVICKTSTNVFKVLTQLCLQISPRKIRYYD